jgi:hypothetical protein
MVARGVGPIMEVDTAVIVKESNKRRWMRRFFIRAVYQNCQI